MAQSSVKSDFNNMEHSEVHYFNSYNHHGIHEEMLVRRCTFCFQQS